MYKKRPCAAGFLGKLLQKLYKYLGIPLFKMMYVDVRIIH